jgi:hypothetical protein
MVRARAGGATDGQDGPLPASALAWTVILDHRASNCNRYPTQPFDGRRPGGSFSAPDYEYPSLLEPRLTATNSGSLTDTESVQLDPKTVSSVVSHIRRSSVWGVAAMSGVLLCQTRSSRRASSSPSWFALVLNGAQLPAPFSRTVIQGSTNTILGPAAADEGEEVVAVPVVVGRGTRTHVVSLAMSRRLTSAERPGQRAEGGLACRAQTLARSRLRGFRTISAAESRHPTKVLSA